MLTSVKGKKIELLPKVPKENQKLCDVCEGVGWLKDDKGYIELCRNCSNGIIECCPHCGKPYSKRHYHHCDNEECQRIERFEKEKRYKEQERQRFEKAIKLDYNNADEGKIGMLYIEGYGNDGYITDLDEFFECYYDRNQENLEIYGEPLERPEYVWATSCSKISLDADRILEQATDDLHEDARDRIVDEDELQSFLDKWCEKQTGTETYYPDYRYAILIPWDRY